MKKTSLYLFLVAFPLALTGCGGTTPSHTHNYGTLHSEVAATCEKDGSIAYYQCDGCNKYFNSDKKEVSQADLVIKALGHDYGSLHAGHDATCEEPGNVAYYQCSRCQQYFDSTKTKIDETKIPIQPKGHNYGTLHDKVEATCEDDGHEAYYLCEDCGTYFTIEKVKTTLEDLTISAKGHNYGNLFEKEDATCELEGHEAYYYCEDCANYFTEQKVKTTLEDLTIPAKGHQMAESWSADDTNHWHQCENCDHKEDVDAHTLVKGYDQNEHWDKCSTCEHVISSTKEAHTLSDWSIDVENEERYKSCSSCDYRLIDEDADVQSFEVATLGYTAAGAIQFTYKMTIPGWASGSNLNTEHLVIKVNGVVTSVNSIQYFSDSNTVSINLGFNGKTGDLFVIETGSYFNEGNLYRAFKKDLTCAFDGNSWKLVNKVVDSFEYSWGANNVVMFKDPLERTDLDNPQTLYIDNSLYVASINGKVINNIQGFYTPGKSAEEVEANDIYKLHFQGFDALEDGDVLTFYKGSLFIANDVVYLSKDIGFKWDEENEKWVDTDPQVITVDPYLTITGVSYGTSKLLQVSYEANCGTGTKEIKSDFAANTEGFVVDQGGSSQNLWYTTKNTGTFKMSYNFSSDFTAGQYYIIGANSQYVLEDDTAVTITQALKFTFDGSGWTMEEYVAERLISFTPGYATSSLIQVNTGIADAAEVPPANFLLTDHEISWYGNATVAWVTVNSATTWTINFSNSTEGQYIVLEKGSKWTMATGHEYTLDADYMFVCGASSWAGRKMLDNELTFINVLYSTSKVNQVLTNSSLDAKGADTSSGGNGIIDLKHTNDTVLWGYYGNGIHPSYNTLYLTFNFNSDCAEGAIMTIDKETTLVLSDDSVVKVGANYKFTYTSGSWVMTLSI